jgi:hypothetical protein
MFLTCEPYDLTFLTENLENGATTLPCEHGGGPTRSSWRFTVLLYTVRVGQLWVTRTDQVRVRTQKGRFFMVKFWFWPDTHKDM